MEVRVMNTTTQGIVSQFNKRKSEYKNDTRLQKSLSDFINTRIGEEIVEIEASSSSCTLEETRKYRASFGSIPAVELGDEIRSRFASADMMRIMACELNAIFYRLPGEPGYSEGSERVKEWITGLKTFGAPSSGGVAMTGGIDDVQNMFVVKVAQKENSTELIHEAFVGMARRDSQGIGGLNYLRKFIPNFAFIYGAFYCSPPVIDPETKSVIEICSKDSAITVPYTIYEQVFPSVSAQRYLVGSSINSFLSMYMQVVMATFFAFTYNEYTHYDLHDQNVLMRNVSDKPFQIRYQFSNDDVYITSTDVATIIDYGMTHIKHDEKSYGTHEAGLYPFWILPNKAWPFHDIYKFTCFLLRDAIDASRSDIIRILEKIIRYFNRTDTIDTIINGQYVDRYALPNDDHTSKFSLASFIVYLVTKLGPDGINEVVKTQRDESIPILTCDGLKYRVEICPGQRELESKLSAKGHKSFFAIYDQKLTDRPYSMSSSEYAQESSELHQKIEREKHELLTYMRPPSQLQNIDLDSMSLGDVQTMQFLKRQFMTLLKVVSSVESLEVYLSVGKYVAGLYQDHHMMERLNSVDEMIRTYSPAICEVNENAQMNYAKIYNFVGTDMYKGLVKRDKEFNWYSTEAGKIVSLGNRGCMFQIKNVVGSQKSGSAYTKLSAEDEELMRYGRAQSRTTGTNPSVRSASPVRSLMR